MQTNIFLVRKIVLKILFILVVTSFTASGSVKQIRFVIYDICTYVVAKVYWRIKYTLASKFEAILYFSLKLQTWRLMCTLSPNLEAKVILYM